MVYCPKHKPTIDQYETTLRKVTPNPGFSFTIRKDTADAMVNNWHYHPEFEILYLKKSAGTWLIGDHIGHFQCGDVVLLGSNLPHCYKHDPEFLVKNGKEAGESIGVLFHENVFGQEFLTIPENDPIRNLLSIIFMKRYRWNTLLH